MIQADDFRSAACHGPFDQPGKVSSHQMMYNLFLFSISTDTLTYTDKQRKGGRQIYERSRSVSRCSDVSASSLLEALLRVYYMDTFSSALSLYSIFYLFSLISWLLSISPLFLSAVCDVIEDRETHGRLFPFVYSSCVSAAWQPRQINRSRSTSAIDMGRGHIDFSNRRTTKTKTQINKYERKKKTNTRSGRRIHGK